MQQLMFTPTTIAGLILISPMYAPDDRGYMSKVFEKQIFSDNGIELAPYEELTSCSHKGVLRGLHFQTKHSQNKLVRVLYGTVYDVAVDLRKDSPTFGQWEGFYLSATNRQMLYIPKGFAHGFLSLEEGTCMNYICGAKYCPGFEDGILWNDEYLNIAWPIERVEQIQISQRDQQFQTFKQFMEQYQTCNGGC